MNSKDNVRVIVDAGHGGTDPGAVNGNIYEKDFNLQAAQYIYKRLKELGIPVEMTRTEDISLPKDERIEKVQSFGLDLNTILVSNHINSGGSDISNYEGLNLKKLFTTTFLIFFSTATWAWFIPANFSFWHF